MSRFSLTFLLLLILTVPAAADEWVALQPGAKAGTPPVIKVLSATTAGTVLEITVPGYWTVQDARGARLRLPGGATGTVEGRPELPFLTCTLATPTADAPRYTVRRADWQLPGPFTVRMAPKPELGGQTHPSPAPFLPGVDHPATAVFQVHAGHWRDVPQVSVQIHPFRARGDGTLLGVAARMVVDVVHTRAPLAWPPMVIPAGFQDAFRAVCLNWRAVTPGQVATEAPATEYLALGPAALKSGVDPLLEWRRAQGYEVEWVSLTTTNPAAIKAEIMTRYNAGKLKHVLLVGDYGEIPYYTWGGTHSDIWYVCLTGGGSPDLYPDAGLGRLSGSSLYQIQNQAAKILNYETKPPAGSWYTRTILAAHREQAPGKYVGCSETIAAGALSTSGWTTIKQYGHVSGVTNTTVSNHINTGVGLVNYRGHGSTTGWVSGWCLVSGEYNASRVYSLTNTGMTPVVFNIACYNGNFKSNCLQEAWLQSKGGAVASLGAILPSYTTANHAFDQELYAAIFGSGLTNIYDFWYKGVAKLIAVGSAGQANAKMYWWGGDCATCMWGAVPKALTVTHPTSINAPTTSTLAVVVRQGTTPVQGARACLWMGEEIHAVATSDGTGKALFAVAGLPNGTIKVTVTARDHLPYRGTVAVTGGITPGVVIPSGLKRSEGNASQAVPARYAPARCQVLYDVSVLKDLQAGTIKRLALRRDGLGTTTYAAHKFLFDVSISTVGVPIAGRWNHYSYQANRGTNHTRVLSGYTVDFPASPPPAALPAPFTLKLPLTTPITYKPGGSLLVEFDVAEAPGGKGDYPWLLDAHGDDSAQPAYPLGYGCPGATPLSGRVAYPGKLEFSWSSGGGYASPAVGFLGGSIYNWGSMVLPYSLAGLGAPGCSINTDFVLGFPGTTDATGIKGRFGFDLVVPYTPYLVGQYLFAQALVADATFNAAGLRVSPALMYVIPENNPQLQLSSYGSQPPFSDVPDHQGAAALVLEIGM